MRPKPKLPVNLERLVDEDRDFCGYNDLGDRCFGCAEHPDGLAADIGYLQTIVDAPLRTIVYPVDRRGPNEFFLWHLNSELAAMKLPATGGWTWYGVEDDYLRERMFGGGDLLPHYRFELTCSSCGCSVGTGAEFWETDLDQARARMKQALAKGCEHMRG
jgi:hypothetical protein